MPYIIKSILMALVIISLSACSIGTASNVSMDEAEKQSDKHQQTEKKMPTTTTTASPYADSILKDERKGIVPTKVDIPAIDLSAPVEHVGLKENGEMAVTESFEKTGWYEKGYKPGEAGNAVIGGHVDSRNGPAIFYNLRDLTVGDEVIVTGENGVKKTFVVTDKQQYPWDESPLTSIFGYSHSSSLNLITCSGVFDRSSHNYNKRLVVYTKLKE
jgi:LPXTG-site transpeptidase (sortase) family protein